MKTPDKLEQYIKKEIESITYDGEDQMWEEFQKTKLVALSEYKPKRNYIKYFLLAIVPIMSLVSILYFQNGEDLSSQNSIVDTSVANNESDQLVKSDLTTIIPAQRNNEFETVQSGSDVNMIRTIDIKTPKGSNIISSSASKKQELRKVIGVNKKDTNLASINNLKAKKSINIAGKPIEKNTGFTDVDGTQNLASTKHELTTATGNNNNNNNIADGTRNDLEINETAVDINKKLKLLPIIMINPIPDNSNSLVYITQEIEIKTDPDYKRHRGFFGRAGIQASTNNIVQSYTDLGYRHLFRQHSGFKLSFGFNVVDGYSFSQDSLEIFNGVSTLEKFKNKDLDYIFNIQSNLEYIYKIKSFSISIGPRLSYAIRNEVTEISNSDFTFLNLTQMRTKETILSNYWNGMNRYSVEGLFSLSYHKNRYEFGVTISKRLNKLIVTDEAFSRKSNTPFLFGAMISYNLN
jgi:hypothetical protein